jgi:hypothetical protein
MGVASRRSGGGARTTLVVMTGALKPDAGRIDDLFMTWAPPSARALPALHLACAAPPIALVLWFGAIDRLPFGEGRCSSCGVEGYVIAAHVVAAARLGVVVACTAAARREVREGIGTPGRATIGALAGVALFVTASLAWHPLSTPPVLAAMLASVVLFPVAAICWVVGALVWWRRPPRTEAELRRRLAGTLAAAWISLTLVVPAIFGWVWADRVDWLVF